MVRSLVVFSLAIALALPVSANVVAPLSGASEALIPVAGSVTGVGGVPFLSDVRITNLRTQEQRIAIYWVPQFVTGVDLAPKYFILPANGGTLASDDFADVIQRRGAGLGAILVQTVQPNNALDENGRIDVSTRIWSPRDDGGSTSQNLPAVATRQLVNHRAVILGQRRDAQYRTNVGIVNLDRTITQRYTITVSGDNPTLVPEVVEVDVPPFSMRQVALPGIEQPNLRIDVEVARQPGGGIGTLWAVYGATVDNITGDSWSSLGFDVSELQ